MTDLINGKGDVAHERTAACIEHIKSTVRDHLDCLIDSGAESTDVKAVAQLFCEAIGEASKDALKDLTEQIEAKEAEEYEEDEDE